MKKLIIFLYSLALLLAFPAAILAQSSAPTIASITPSEGQTIYGNKIPVLIAYENFKLVDYKTNTVAKSGEGHIHLWLDEANPTAENAVKLTEETFTYNDVPFGDHTLVAELVNNDHTPLAPPQKFTVHFKNSPISSPSPTIKSGIDKNTALVIFVVVALVIVAAWWYTKEDVEEEVKSEKSKPKVRKITKNKASGRRRS